jgi:acyl-CoA thioesterase-2
VTAETAGGVGIPDLEQDGRVGVLLSLLDLEPIETNIFRASPTTAGGRVFGGQVGAQALIAAGRTVEPERQVHSLHSYFIRPGDPFAPIIYTVERVRDGQSFSVRRVVAVQHGEAIFTLSASFQLPQGGIDHQTQMPDAPPPESLPTLVERLRGYDAVSAFMRTVPHPFDVRYVDDPPWAQRALGPREDRSHRVWLRIDGSLPEDPLLQVCAVTFASDLNLLDSVLVHHGLAAHLDPIWLASLDLAMWFHRPFQADEWFLYVSSSPSASGGRGLATGRYFSRDGRHLASVAQEGLIRLPNA